MRLRRYSTESRMWHGGRVNREIAIAPTPARALRRRGPLALGLLFLWLTTACGRPATLAECNEIVSRITELELKSRGGASQNQEVVRETVDALRKTTLKDCVGRRIDDGAMACVRSASNAQQLVKECF
jgi:hypothetical protein